MSSPRVVVVTAARDEAANLPRLIDVILAQDLRPLRWTIVDVGSTDATRAIALEAARRHAWIEVASLRDHSTPVVDAIELVANAVAGDPPELLVNVDADVSFERHFLRALSLAFDAEPTLGIASGTCYERSGDSWRECFVTGSRAWAATRAYRWDCLQSVRPLERRAGWDGIDELRAHARGWSTRTLRDLPFRHHPSNPERERRWTAFSAQGSTAHFMGYRHSYLLLRALHHARRHPSAVAMYLTFLGSAAAHRSRLGDDDARAYLRSQQTLRALGRRLRNAGGAAPVPRL